MNDRVWPYDHPHFLKYTRIMLNDLTSAASVTASTASIQEAGSGSTPRAAPQSLRVQPVPIRVAKTMIVHNHYLHSLPGGTQLAFGIFVEPMLLGAMTFGVGPFNAHRLVSGASADDCAVLTRFWLSDELRPNSESRVLGIVTRALRRHTNIKFLVSYADPSKRHIGIIYQATNWIYTGLSNAVPLYELGDGVDRHSRSVSHAFGTHSLKHFEHHGLQVKLVPQTRKHRHVYFLDTSWRSRLQTEALPYPKQGDQ